LSIVPQGAFLSRLSKSDKEEKRVFNKALLLLWIYL
jgi:hypothetical protein